MKTTPAVRISEENTSDNAIGAGAYVLYQARGACYVERVVFQPLGSNSATVVRVFVNNGKDHTNGSNNALRAEATAAGTTASQTAGLASVPVTTDLYLEPGQRLLVTIGTAPTDGFDVTADVGDHYSDFNV